MPPSGALCISMDQKLMTQQREEAERKRELAQELVQDWAIYQRSEDSRDADINYNHQGGPDVSLVDQESLGPASMQVFEVFICPCFFAYVWVESSGIKKINK